jgi:hypothetical protein
LTFLFYQQRLNEWLLGIQTCSLSKKTAQALSTIYLGVVLKLEVLKEKFVEKVDLSVEARGEK